MDYAFYERRDGTIFRKAARQAGTPVTAAFSVSVYLASRHFLPRYAKPNADAQLAVSLRPIWKKFLPRILHGLEQFTPPDRNAAAASFPARLIARAGALRGRIETIELRQLDLKERYAAQVIQQKTARSEQAKARQAAAAEHARSAAQQLATQQAAQQATLQAAVATAKAAPSPAATQAVTAAALALKKTNTKKRTLRHPFGGK